MIRKLLLPALAAVLLGGCVTGYDYRGGTGDYYYGQPSVDYYDGYYGGYGYPGWSGMMGFGYGYGGYGGYGYGGYGYGYPYYGYPYYPPVIIVRPHPPRPDHPDPHPPGQRPPGHPDPSGPGRRHPRLPSPVAPMPNEVPAAGGPRFNPSPYPQERIRREPSQPTRHQMPESSRPERDDSLKPQP